MLQIISGKEMMHDEVVQDSDSRVAPGHLDNIAVERQIIAKIVIRNIVLGSSLTADGDVNFRMGTLAEKVSSESKQKTSTWASFANSSTIPALQRPIALFLENGVNQAIFTWLESRSHDPS
jgi:hypothetical protein